MTLTFTARLAAGDLLLDTDLRGLDIVETGQGPVLHARAWGGLTAWSLRDGATATLENSLYQGFSAPGMGGIAAVTLGGQSQLVFEGAGRMLRAPLDATGLPGTATTFDLPGQGVATLATQALKQGAVLYCVDTTGALGGWHTDTGGQITDAVTTRGRDAAYLLDSAAELEIARAGGSAYLLAADAGGVTSYRSRPGGDLDPADHLGPGDGLGIARPTALEVVQAFGRSWAILAAAGSGSLSVMRLDPGGGLSPADHLVDTLATRFGGVTALKVVKAGGRVLVLAGGADDGLSLFTLVPGGRLVHLETLAHDSGLGLENITAIEAAQLDDVLQVFVASGTQGGITQFALPLDGLGHIRIAGRHGDPLSGHDGADVFVLKPAVQSLEITGFQPGLDRIDTGLFPMLRSPAQLHLHETDTGAVLKIGDSVIRIFSAEGSPLDAADLWPDGFAGPDRVPVPDAPLLRWTQGTARGDRLVGHRGGDLIEGGGGADILRGRAGADQLHGQRGADHLFGGGGSDLLTGGLKGDRLAGRAGPDRLLGNRGEDRLIGGTGADRLDGGRGDDRLAGGGGADTFRFGARHGRDTITDFTPGTDHLRLTLPGLDFGDLTLRAAGEDTVIRTGAGRILLEDISPADLGPDDILFG